MHELLASDEHDSGWDMHDTVYPNELLISNRANGYRDLLAVIDLTTYRRIPWENNVPFFLVSFQWHFKLMCFVEKRGEVVIVELCPK